MEAWATRMHVVPVRATNRALFLTHMHARLLPPCPPLPPQAANIRCGGSPWDVVMAGAAEGLLLRVPALQPGCLDAAWGKVSRTPAQRSRIPSSLRLCCCFELPASSPP